MLTILLLGELGKRYGRQHRMDVRSPAEAIRALAANFPDFASWVSSSADRNVGYRVIAGDHSITADELHNPASRRVIIAPVIMGSGGDDPFTNLLIGGAMILLAFGTGGVSLTATGLTFSGLGAQVAFGIGVSLALGGVAQLLAPTPPGVQPLETTPSSYVFDGAVNVTAQGNPVPIGYGRMIVGSAVISAGITVDDLSVIEQKVADPAAFYDPNAYDPNAVQT
jgi:predicted phage tail protein